MIQAFTGLRAIACLILVVYRYLPQIESLKEGALQSVYFFFVLSGYLLMRRGLVDIQPSKNKQPVRFCNKNMLLSYLTKRLFRIYPAFIVSVFAYRAFLPDSPILDSLLLRAKGPRHFWTLRIELIFYLLMLPTVLIIISELSILEFKYLRNSRWSLRIPFYLLVTLAITYVQIQKGNIRGGYSQRSNFLVHAPAFWNGCLGGIASNHLRINEFNLKKQQRILEALSYVLLIRIFFQNAFIAQSYLCLLQVHWIQNHIAQAPVYALFLLVLEITREKNSMTKAISSSLLLYMG
ncbi:MAG: acyltransferase family protein, partial [Bacteroidia bacterium]